MGKRTIYTDDLDGTDIGEDAKPLRFSIGEQTYSIYLTPDNEGEFRDAFKKYTDVAEKVGGSGGSSATKKASGTGSTERHGFAFPDVLAWAVATGQKGKGGGPISETTKVLHQGIWDGYKEHMESDQKK